LTALNHREADRIPFDLGSTQVTGIHQVAYRALRKAIGLPELAPQLCDHIQQLALPDPDFLERLKVDTRGLYPLNSHNWNVNVVIQEDNWVYHDEWGIVHRRPYPYGLYFSIFRVPLDDPELSINDIENYPWPKMDDPQRIRHLRSQAEVYQSQGYAVVLKDPFAGIFEMAQRMVGMENLLVMMLTQEKLAEALFEKMSHLKLAFWEMALPQLADMVDVISQTDDYGTQQSQLISPRMYRRLIKPYWRSVLQRIRQLAPHARLFFHSCGNVRPLIPDLIEIGVDILNPIHIRATGMEPGALKRDFGDALVFWGGGVDTQNVLPYGSPKEVKEDVQRNIQALAPGGGFVFSAVHNIQADVPPENFLAMWEALFEFTY